MSRSFLADQDPAELANDRSVLELDRTLAAFDSDQPVGFATAASRAITVPGAELPFAAVTAVAVAATHHRRGILTQMMRRQLQDIHDAGREPIAALWASEPVIYGRFGYGLATQRARTTVDTRACRLRADVDRGDGQIVVCPPADARPDLELVYDLARVDRVGYLTRPGAWWDVRLSDPESFRDGASSLQCVLHRDGTGRPDGYAVYRMKSSWGPDGPDGEFRVIELVATTPAAHAALWGHLLETDLLRRIVVAQGDVDEPLVHLVADANGIARSVSDGMWVRLVDVGAALTARRYAHEVDVVLAVDDPLCPWNSGRWRLRGSDSTASSDCAASCTPTVDDADLTVDIRALGGAFLGGTLLSSLAAAGQVVEHRPGILAATSAAFAGLRPPHCPEVF